ncbi:hypothetical protein B9T66_00270 [Helicobacter sp. TUL]|uniref:hypothetical protein n=1 Tax=Helicobacter sp. TUL TaxID=1848928 RepID=UPI000BAB9438|nr:hypothetical protein [Helicobacter sp. TUL]PAV00868.1 hypothetical protein B9T66_00270 [Helicobacter sp. TUL]
MKTQNKIFQRLVFGVVAVVVVSAVFVLSQPKTQESSTISTLTEEAVSESMQESNDSEAQSPEALEIKEESSADSNPHSHSLPQAQTSDVATTSPSIESSDTPKTLVVCENDVAVYDKEGRSVIGSAFVGLAGEEVGHIDDKVVLHITSYHNGTQMLYTDSKFDTPMLKVYGLDSTMSLEVAIAKKDLHQHNDTPCGEIKNTQDSHDVPNHAQGNGIQNHGNI